MPEHQALRDFIAEQSPRVSIISKFETLGYHDLQEVERLYMVEGLRTTPELLDHLALVTGPDADEWFRAELASGPSR